MDLRREEKKSNNVEVRPGLNGVVIIWFKTTKCIYNFGKRQTLTLMQCKFEMGSEVVFFFFPLVFLLRTGEGQ